MELNRSATALGDACDHALYFRLNRPTPSPSLLTDSPSCTRLKLSHRPRLERSLNFILHGAVFTLTPPVTNATDPEVDDPKSARKTTGARNPYGFHVDVRWRREGGERGTGTRDEDGALARWVNLLDLQNRAHKT